MRNDISKCEQDIDVETTWNTQYKVWSEQGTLYNIYAGCPKKGGIRKLCPNSKIFFFSLIWAILGTLKNKVFFILPFMGLPVC